MKNIATERVLGDAFYSDLLKQTPASHLMKGLFKSFKTQEEYEVLLSNALETRQLMLESMQKFVERTNQYPFALLPIKLKCIADSNGVNSSGGKFLRWRNVQNTFHGQKLFVSMYNDPRVATEIKEELRILEQEKNAFNMQMKIINFIIRQARLHLTSYIEAEDAYQNRSL